MSDPTDLEEFYLNSTSDIVQLELFEISHPNFSQTYYIVRNASDGITVTHEDSTVHFYTYYPCAVDFQATTDNLDAGFTFTFGDLGELLPNEMENVAAANIWPLVKPTCVYRTYRHDKLTAPMNGPMTFQVQNIVQVMTDDGSAAQMTVTAPQLSLAKTGEIYTIGRFSMLAGLL